MSIQIISDKKNLLLQRREVEFTDSGKTTPSRESIKPELAKALKANEKLLVIDYIEQKMGTNLNAGKAKVYDNEEAMKAISLDYKSTRGIKKKEGEEAAPAAKPVEKKPADKK